MARDYGPGWASPPGKALEEWRARQRMPRRTLSERLELSDAELAELLTGRRELTLPLVLKLQEVTGIPRRMWAAMEALYQAERARSRQLQEFDDSIPGGGGSAEPGTEQAPAGRRRRHR